MCRLESASHWAQTFCRPFGTCMSRGAFPGVRGLTPGCSLAPLPGLGCVCRAALGPGRNDDCLSACRLGCRQTAGAALRTQNSGRKCRGRENPATGFSHRLAQAKRGVAGDSDQVLKAAERRLCLVQQVRPGCGSDSHAPCPGGSFFSQIGSHAPDGVLKPAGSFHLSARPGADFVKRPKRWCR